MFDWTSLMLFVGGLITLILGAEVMLRGAVRLSYTFGISPLVVGLTVVAFGTSAPELAVSTVSALSGKVGIAVGNVVGSNICNVLLILGLSALAAPLHVSRQLVRIEVPLMIAAALAMWWFAQDGVVGRGNGLILFGTVVVYTVWTVARSRRKAKAEALKTTSSEELDRIRQSRSLRSIARDLVMVVAGLAMLAFGSDWLVTAAVTVATALGVSELVIGLTVVSIGTSLPEIATSVVASMRGQREIAVGNVVGSNLFNILVVLGVTALIAPNGVAVTRQAITFDIPIMIGVMVLCLPVFWTGYRISRLEGGLLLGYYVCYTTFIVLTAMQHPVLATFSAIMTHAVLPITGLGMLVVLFQFLVRLWHRLRPGD